MSSPRSGGEGLPAYTLIMVDERSFGVGWCATRDRHGACRLVSRARAAGAWRLPFPTSTGLAVPSHPSTTLPLRVCIRRVVANDAASYQYLVESIRMFPDQETWAGVSAF